METQLAFLIAFFVIVAIGLGVWFNSRQEKRYLAEHKEYSAPKAPNPSLPVNDFDSRMDSIAAQLGGDWFHARVSGVSYINDDGSSRQDIIADKLEIWQQLALVHEPDNPYDKNAVQVLIEEGDLQIGYLPARVAAETVSAMSGGTLYSAFVRSIKPTEAGFYGVVIAIVRWEPKD